MTDDVDARVEPVPADPPEDEEDGGSPLGLFVLTGFLGLMILLHVLTRGRTLTPAWGPLPALAPAVIAAWLGAVRVTISSLSGIREGEIGADLALAIACWASIYIGEPLAAAEVVFIAMTGESLEEVAYARTSRALERLLAMWPKVARKLVGDREVEVDSSELVPGDRVIVRPGERLPVDGLILQGSTSLDESTVTGESVPVDKARGDRVFSGTQNLHGAIQIEAEAVGEASSLGQVVALVREAQEKKAPIQRAADLYAAYFLPVVLACALITYLVSRDLFRTVAVLVIACPCALVLATPAAVLAGIGRLARLGVLVKGGEALEAMARVNSIAFDKTGTLTLARLELGDVIPSGGVGADELLAVAASVETLSEHPLARTICREANRRGLALTVPDEVESRPGLGVVAGDRAVGNAALMAELGWTVEPALLEAAEALASAGQTPVLVAASARVIGLLGARDTLRGDATDVVAELRRLGLDRLALLTGDREAVARSVGAAVGIDEIAAEQRPADKVAWVRGRLAAGERVAFVGDGINDAPALAAANVGVAVAETASDIACEAADVVLRGDPLAQLPRLVTVSRRVLRTIKISIFGFAFGLNGVAVVLSAMGRLTPIQAAVFHQVGSLAVLLNSLRLLGFEPRADSPVRGVFGRLGDLLGALVSIDIDAGVGWLAERWRQLLRGAALAALALWALSCLVPIGPDQVAVIRVLGRQQGTWGPGLALKPWWPVGRATRLRPDEVRTVEIGYRAASTRPAMALEPGQYDWNSAHLAGAYERREEEALMITGDENLIEMQASIQYTIADPGRFLFAAAQVPELVRGEAEAALRRTVAERAADSILTDQRGDVEREAAERLQTACDELGLGLRIAQVRLGDVHPPLEVVPAFRAVSSAFEHKQQKVNEAEGYYNEQVPLARGEAAAKRTSAAAYQAARVRRATGSANRFARRAQAAVAGRGVTMTRLHLETTERLLGGRPLLILDPTVAARRQMWTLDGPLADLLGRGPALSVDAAPAPQPESPTVPFNVAPPQPTAPTGVAP